MLKLHAVVYALPPEVAEGNSVTLRSQSFTPLVGSEGAPPAFSAALTPSFEEIQERLLKLPSSDCEPDGYFLVTGRENGHFWRLNGHMHEHAGRMHRVELNGECPAPDLDAVLRTFGWPETELVFQLVHEGVTLREGDFREWADDELSPGLPPTQRAGASPPPDTPVSTTPWHITFGTYGTRLHGGRRLTVDKNHNQVGGPFVQENLPRYVMMKTSLKHPPVRLSEEQRGFTESTIPGVCEKGGWHLLSCAAGKDHVHVICEADSAIHGEKIRRLMKRWLSQALSSKWPLPDGGRWWADEGSNRSVHSEGYLRAAIEYVDRQRFL